MALPLKPSPTDLGGKCEVQFNPSELTFSRSLNLDRKKALGSHPGLAGLTAVNANWTTMSLSLYFDSYTGLKGGDGLTSAPVAMAAKKLASMPGAALAMQKASKYVNSDMNTEHWPDADSKVNKRLEQILAFIEFDPETHAPPIINFIWGDKISFIGAVTSQTTRYTMFHKNGTPVRAKLDLQMTGMTSKELKAQKKNPFQSPDRTKLRMLGETDELWLLAAAEYGDASRWKEIAAANHIANPRTMPQVAMVKVPALK